MVYIIENKIKIHKAHMIKNLYFLKFKRYNLLILGVFLWLYVCSNINAYPLTLLKLKTAILFGDLNIVEKVFVIFNFFRSYSVYFIPLILFFIVKYKNEIKLNIFINLYLLFFLSQVIGTLMLLDIEKYNYERNFLLYNSFSALLVAYFLSMDEIEKYLKYFLLLTLSLLFFVVAFHIFKIIEEYIYNPEMFFFYNSQLWGKLVLGNAYIRVTGLSRSLMLIFIVLFSINLFQSNSKMKKIILNILIFFTIFFIWILQSRTQIYLLPILVSVMFLFFYNKQNNKKIFINLFLISLYFALSYLLVPKLYDYKKDLYKNADVNSNFSKKYLIEKNKIEKEVLEQKNFEKEISRNLKNFEKEISRNLRKQTLETIESNVKKKQLRVTIIENFTSSRILIWKNMLSNFDKMKLFGYGNQADRFELSVTQSENKYNHFYNNSSNALVYSFICGGYIGLIIFIIINLYILYKILIILKNNNKFKKDWSLISSISIIIFLMLRSIVENGHANFSLDFLIFVLCSLIIIKKSKKLVYFKN